MRTVPTIGFLGLCLLAPVCAVADPIGWAQPGGPGSPVDITYSYSNLFDGGFDTTLTRRELRRFTEQALGVWARHAPLNFLERPDSGPPPGSGEYAAGHPDIRIGYQPRLPGGATALGYRPFDRDGREADGLDGDVHFSNDLSAFGSKTWGIGVPSGMLDFFSVALHELGHAIGIGHIFGEPAVMSGELVRNFQSGEASLFPADLRELGELYGAGTGFVRPLDEETAPVPEPATIVLVSTAVGLALRRRRNAHRKG